MTLVVARRVGNGVILVSDTHLTRSDQGDVAPHQGVLKSIFISPTQCVSFAGNYEVAEDAMRFILSNQPMADVELKNYLLKTHLDSNQDVDFILLLGWPHTEIAEIKNGQLTGNVSNSWIGSQPAFNLFQSLLANPQSSCPPPVVEGKMPESSIAVSMSLQFMRQPEHVDLVENAFPSNFLSAMRNVILSSDQTGVDGFAIMVASDKDGLSYIEYQEIVSSGQEIPADNEVHFIHFGTVQTGGLSKSVTGTTAPCAVAIHYLQGKKGILFAQKANQFRGLLIQGGPLAFSDQVESLIQVKIPLMHSDEFEIIEFALRFLQESRLEEALNMVDKALVMNSNSSFGHSTRGLILGQMGKDEEALSELDLGVELDKVYPGPLLDRASFFCNQQRLVECLRDIEEALARNPNQQFDLSYPESLKRQILEVFAKKTNEKNLRSLAISSKIANDVAFEIGFTSALLSWWKSFYWKA